MSLNAFAPDIGPREFWTCLGQRPVGATVVTSQGPEDPNGFLGLSFAHVSATPPVVLVSVGAKTTALETIRSSGAFAVNLLSSAQGEVARAFGGDLPAKERFRDLSYATLTTGAPILDMAAAAFDCEVLKAVETEGTTTFFGSVVALVTRDRDPLIAYSGGFRSL